MGSRCGLSRGFLVRARAADEGVGAHGAADAPSPTASAAAGVRSMWMAPLWGAAAPRAMPLAGPPGARAMGRGAGRAAASTTAAGCSCRTAAASASRGSAGEERHLRAVRTLGSAATCPRRRDGPAPRLHRRLAHERGVGAEHARELDHERRVQRRQPLSHPLCRRAHVAVASSAARRRRPRGCSVGRTRRIGSCRPSAPPPAAATDGTAGANSAELLAEPPQRVSEWARGVDEQLTDLAPQLLGRRPARLEPRRLHRLRRQTTCDTTWLPRSGSHGWGRASRITGSGRASRTCGGGGGLLPHHHGAPAAAQGADASEARCAAGPVASPPSAEAGAPSSAAAAASAQRSSSPRPGGRPRAW